MEPYKITTLPIEELVRQGLAELNYLPSGAMSGTEYFKEANNTRKTFSYHFAVDYLVCTHETRLLITGSRTIKVIRLQVVDEVMDSLKELDATVVKY